MKGINHLITTGSAYVICMNAFPETFHWMTAPAGLAFALVGSLLPDVDCHTSKVGKLVPFVSYPVELILGHRGAFHSLLAAGGLLYLVNLVAFPWAYSLTFGFIGHLVGDACTKSGVNFFWPLSRKVRLPLTPASNSVFEFVTSAICLFTAFLVTINS